MKLVGDGRDCIRVYAGVEIQGDLHEEHDTESHPFLPGGKTESKLVVRITFHQLAFLVGIRGAVVAPCVIVLLLNLVLDDVVTMADEIILVVCYACQRRLIFQWHWSSHGKMKRTRSSSLDDLRRVPGVHVAIRGNGCMYMQSIQSDQRRQDQNTMSSADIIVIRSDCYDAAIYPKPCMHMKN